MLMSGLQMWPCRWVSRWIALDAVSRGFPKLLLAPCVFLTIMAGKQGEHSLASAATDACITNFTAYALCAVQAPPDGCCTCCSAATGASSPKLRDPQADIPGNVTTCGLAGQHWHEARLISRVTVPSK